MEHPDRLPYSSRQRRELHGRPVDSANQNYGNSFARDQQQGYDDSDSSSWEHWGADPRPQASNHKKEAYYESSRSSAKHREQMPQHERSLSDEDWEVVPRYDRQPIRERVKPQPRGSLAGDRDPPKAHREHKRPRRREPEPQYDTKDSYGRTRSNKQESEKYGVDSYASDGLKSQEAWRADYSSSRDFDVDEIVKQTVDRVLRDGRSSRSVGYQEQGPYYPPAVGIGESYNVARNVYYPPEYDPGVFIPIQDDENDEYEIESDSPRGITGADGHNHLPEPPSDQGSRRRRRRHQ